LMVISGHFLAALNSFEFLFVDMPQDFFFDFLLQNRLYSFALESFHDLNLLIWGMHMLYFFEDSVPQIQNDLVIVLY
jgi:hypothetical protein